MPRLSLERLCEQIVAEHDYDLAVLAQWDGRRRYANMRKLARLARSYEELRGPDVEGFVRFVAEQEAVGAHQLEAVAEEEGADAVRLLTIHAAKGLEFKVVIVADAGRDRVAPSPDEILALPDGRFGFRVADPVTAKRRGAFDYEAVKEARQEAEQAERLRLYYVAMTRARERLIVSGSVDFGKASEVPTPIAWVLERLEADEELARAGDSPIELARGDARLLVRVDRYPRGAGCPAGRCGRARRGPARVVRLARGRRRADAARAVAPGARRRGCAAAPPRPPALVHGALDLRAVRVQVLGALRDRAEGAGRSARRGWDVRRRGRERRARAARAHRPRGAGRAGDRGRARPCARERVLGSTLAQRLGALPGVTKERHFTFEHDGVLVHGFLDVLQLAEGKALVVDYKTDLIGESSPEEIVEADYRLQRPVYALACSGPARRRSRSSTQFLEAARTSRRGRVHARRAPALEAELSAAIARLQAGEFRPTPSEFACAGCPRSTSSAPVRGFAAGRAARTPLPPPIRRAVPRRRAVPYLPSPRRPPRARVPLAGAVGAERVMQPRRMASWLR